MLVSQQKCCNYSKTNKTNRISIDKLRQPWYWKASHHFVEMFNPPLIFEFQLWSEWSKYWSKKLIIGLSISNLFESSKEGMLAKLSPSNTFWNKFRQKSVWVYSHKKFASIWYHQFIRIYCNLGWWKRLKQDKYTMDPG